MKYYIAALGLMALVATIGYQPAFAQELGRDKEGTLACVGNHLLRQGGSEISFSGYTFRNFNADSKIRIDSVTIYDADGIVLANLTSGSFPAGFKSVLGPNQTTRFTTRDIFGDANIRAPTPLQTIVKWTADRRGTSLFGNVARQDRGRDRLSGAIREQRARGILGCVSLI